MSPDAQRIKDAIDMPALVAEYAELRPSGPKSYKALCCFHNERTPSMLVHPRFFKCHGCGAGGDCFSFLQRIEGIGFREALKRLADRAGISLEGKPVSKGEAALAARNARECAFWWKNRTVTDAEIEAGWAQIEAEGLKPMTPLTAPERFAVWRSTHDRASTNEFLQREADWRMIDDTVRQGIIQSI